MKRHTARLAKVVLICPRCGQKKSISSRQSKFMVLCSRCGAGMREKTIES